MSNNNKLSKVDYDPGELESPQSSSLDSKSAVQLKDLHHIPTSRNDQKNGETGRPIDLDQINNSSKEVSMRDNRRDDYKGFKIESPRGNPKNKFRKDELGNSFKDLHEQQGKPFLYL